MKILSLFFAFLFCLNQQLQASSKEVPEGIRLPTTVEPLQYELSLDVNPDEDSFSGRVKIRLQIKKETKVIWMHGKDLRVQEAVLQLQDAGRVSGAYKQVMEDGTVRIDLSETVSPQTATLEIVYSAPFNKRLEGLYKVGEKGKSYAFTQFESISARLCFPGFDEPSFKTPFDIQLTVPANHAAITNTSATEETLTKEGKKRIQFAQTRKIPTYLIAIAVGPFDVVSGPDIAPNEFRSTAVPLRGVAVQGKGLQLAYALKNTGEILETLERYFGIGYPFGKLDLIAVPDFDWGAMENAGAVTFRENLLLMDEKSASYNQKQSYASVMAHELAHQWFGNLVTMAWWDDIWLNEGLTSWITDRAMESWDPSYKSMVQATQSSLNIMTRDSTPSVRAVHRRAESAQDIISIGDGIIFNKGAAIPLMFEEYLGKAAFQKFIRHYLKKHEFSNATSEDFLSALSEMASKEVSASYRSFLYQAGVPFLQIDSGCEKGKTSIRLQQSRYTPLGVKLSGSPSWQIPLCVRFQVNGKVERTCKIVSKDEDFVITDRGCADWIMPNANGTGYYRWALSQQGWSNLSKHQNNQLTIQEELTVVDSIQAAFDAGRIDTNDALEAMASYSSSDVKEIAMAPSDLLIFIREHLVQQDRMKEVERFARDLYRPVYNRLGFEPVASDSDDLKQFRTDVIYFLAFQARDPEIRKEAARRGTQYIGYGVDGKIHEAAVDSNLVGTVLSVAAQEAGPGYQNALIQLLQSSNDTVLRTRILYALGRVTSPQDVKRILELSLEPALRTNEILSLVQLLLQEKQNRQKVWTWVRDNYDTLVKRLSPTDAGSISSVAADFCSDEKAREVKHFFQLKVESLPGGTQNLQRVLDRITVCAAKVKAHRNDPLPILQERIASGN